MTPPIEDGGPVLLAKWCIVEEHHLVTLLRFAEAACGHPADLPEVQTDKSRRLERAAAAARHALDGHHPTEVDP